MHVIVVGAGIIGVTTAYYLQQRGCTVTVIERQNGVAQEASFANAGVIAPGYVAPWAQPGMPRKLLSYLFRTDAPITFRPHLNRALWRWVGRWWRECDVQRFAVNKRRMQRVAAYSRTLLHQLRDQHAIDYEQGQGYLLLLRTEQEVAQAAASLHVLATLGVPHQAIDADECRRIEPALHAGTPLAGGIFLPEDETGNCAYFARRLKEIGETEGVRYRLGAAVRELIIDGGRLTGVTIGDERLTRLTCDALVVAAGADSDALLAPAGIKVPLYPVKGYSATAAIGRQDHAPVLSVMDEAHKVAITRMGHRLRVAGTAELGSRRLTLRQSALRTLVQVAGQWFPGAANWSQARYWVGARPMLPDGPPLLGSTAVTGLFLNLGHGSTGWAMACGSGRVVADVVTGRTPEIDLEGLTLQRFC